jgi:transmembrane sensor
MSKVYQFTSNEERLEQASLWIAKIDRGLNQAELSEYRLWIAASQSNKDTLTQMASMWDKMDALERLGGLFPHTPEHKNTFAKRYFAAAASFLLAAVLGVAIWQGGALEGDQQLVQQVISNNAYSTQVGERSVFYMQDNTKVVLNTNSKVNITYTDKQRIFELLRGEMHVTVAHNTAQPLSVYAGGQIIQAVGTAFNVELQQNHIELLVTDGRVLVAEQLEEQINPLKLKTVYLPDTSLGVIKGQKVALGSVAEEVLMLESDDIDANLSWQLGQLVFRGEPLEQVMQEVSRYTNYQFVLADDKIKKLQVAGLFKTDDVTTLLDALSSNFNIEYQRVGPEKIQLSMREDES